MPVRSASAAALASSSSLACSTMPSNSFRVLIAFCTDTGSPIWIAEARVFCGVIGLEVLEPVQVREVEGVRLLRLGQHDARLLLDEAQVEHHLEAAAQGGHVAQVPAGDDHHVRHLPVELLHHLDGDGLLPLDAEGVHGIGQVDGVVLRDLPHDAHAPVEVGVQREHDGVVRHGLHELGGGDLVRRQEHDGGDARVRGDRPPGPPRCRRSRRRPRP